MRRSLAPAGSLAESLTLREARLGPALSLSYDEPVHLGSGDGVWLTDVDGNRLLDAYNNVPQVGHAHPRVTAALAAQARRLTTNTRYLVDEVAAYADRLAALLPVSSPSSCSSTRAARRTTSRSRSRAPSPAAVAP